MSGIKFLLLISSFALITKTGKAQIDCEMIEQNCMDFPEYLSLQPVIDTLFAYGDYENALFYLKQQRLYHPDFNTAKNDSLFYRLIKINEPSTPCGCDFPQREAWISAMGPEGADATSFYIDDKNHYWLGTGSSGGVYHSTDKGKTWQERNLGIGPWHIYAFLQRNDSLYIQVNSSGGSDDGEPRIYYYNPSVQGWSYIPGVYSWDRESSSGIGVSVYFEIEEQNQKSFGEQKTSLNLTAHHGAQYSYNEGSHFIARGIDPKYGFGEEYNYEEMRVFGFKEKNPSIAKLNRTFPRDVFTLPGGNCVESGKNKILLSKSGPYLVKKEKSLAPMSISGLVATDVRQIVDIGDKFFALVNEADIWKYENEEWTCIFNAYEQHISMNNPISLTGYDTRQLNLQKDGSILFSFCGNLWKVEKDESVHPVQIDLGPVKLKYPSSKLIVQSGGYDEAGALYILIDRLKEDQVSNGLNKQPEVSWSTILVKVEGANLEILSETETKGEFLFNDRSGILWHKAYDELQIIAGNSTKSKLTDMWGTEWIGQFSFKANGDFIFMVRNTLWEWSHSNHSFKKIIEELPYSTSCVSYDSQESYYAGTGQKYSESCWGGPYNGESSGVYRWQEGKWRAVLGGPNVWTYALSPNSKYGLAVGTSGSGVQFLKTK